MPCRDSISDAKERFESAVTNGINTLMQQCGYSRDRAVSALMRELNRGGDYTRPQDEEIFEIMRRFGLGIEEAKRSIFVSRAMKHAMANSKSPSEAIQNLTAKISLEKLLYDSSDEEDLESEAGLVTIQPDLLRVKPISSSEHHHHTTSSARKRAASVRKSTNRSRTKTPNASKAIIAGRKRSIEEIAVKPNGESDLNKLKPRDRADSVTAVVDAKLASKKKSNDDESNSNRSTPNVRAKRMHRSDETEGAVNQASTGLHKRIRTDV